MALGGDPSTSLNLLLSHFLADENALPQSLPFILNALNGLSLVAKVDQVASIAEAQAQNAAGTQAVALLKKWTLRINTLLQSKDEKQAHSIGIPADYWEIQIAVLVQLFTTSKSFPDLQRDVTSPQLPKFTTTTCSLIEKAFDVPVSTLLQSCVL
ncbi:hypothetical protein HDV00_010278 [Rhizophlyctis rosea]|nr:hypothetical protein HDV00_010278 [Rhizophlyctis rosea]